jgi:hypothetical protein
MNNNIAEQRSEIRFLLTKKPKGALLLHVRNQCLPIHSIRDISQTGISLFLDYPVAKGDQVAIEYKDGENEIKVSGMVVWQSAPAGTTANSLYLLGINMFSPSTLLSFLQLG